MLNVLSNDEEAYAAMNSTAPPELPDFLVRSRQEVLRLLNGIMSSGTLMSISFLDTDEVAAASLIYVDEASNMLLFECPSSWQNAIKQDDSDSIMLACTYEDSKIQFQAGRGTLVDLDGTTVAGLDIPDFMWRFQRRRDQRHKVAGLTITLNLGFIDCDAEVTDFSMDGIGMMTCSSDVRLGAGEVLENCAIMLPGMGAITVNLAVQYLTPVRGVDRRDMTRVGCRFTGLSAPTRQLITHYLDALAAI